MSKPRIIILIAAIGTTIIELLTTRWKEPKNWEDYYKKLFEPSHTAFLIVWNVMWVAISFCILGELGN